jgi:O-acetylhomoserine (thiol)-lyase
MAQSKSEPRNFGFETRMVHAGQVPDPQHGSRAVPIHQTSSFVFFDADHAAELFDLKQYGHIYSRISNPTTAVLEERVASLEGATGAVATASGMAAQLVALLTLLEPGDEVVSSTHLYGGTVTQFTYTLSKMGVKTTFVDPKDYDGWERAITSKTRALYGETIGNPQGSILDIEKLAGFAAAHRIPLIIDNTLATPWLCRPMDFGATLVTHSATKFLGGHGNSLGGILLDSGKFDYSRFPSIAEPAPMYHNLRFWDTFGHYSFLMKARTTSLRDTGASISPTNAFLLLQGIETLALRMDRHVANAKAVADYLAEHPQVAWVSYAARKDHPDHELAKKYLPKGPGAVLSFGIAAADGKAARERGKKFIESLKLWSHLANIGDVRSLVIHPASTTHQQLSDEELAASGVGPELIRLSVGIETVEDLLWDLDQAFRALSA